MPQNPPENMPRISPYLYYENAGAALDWLTRTFQLTERMRMPGPDGAVMHGELTIADGVIMLGRPGKDFQNPALRGERCGSLYVYVDDVDAHFAVTKGAGATIVSEPEDQFYGDRTYTAEDLEGHHWVFATHNRDIAPEDMRPPGS